MKVILVEGMSDETFRMEMRNSREVAKFILDFLDYTNDKDLAIGHVNDVVVRVSFTHKDTHKRVTIHIPGGVLMPNISKIIADKQCFGLDIVQGVSLKSIQHEIPLWYFRKRVRKMKEIEFRLIVEVTNQYSRILGSACDSYMMFRSSRTKEEERLNNAIYAYADFQKASGIFTVLHLIACNLGEREFTEGYLSKLNDEIYEEYGVPEDAMIELRKYISRKEGYKDEETNS